MMKRNIKMIGFDLDGTLLNSNKEISDYTRDVMREAVKQGVIILPATGRPLTGIPKPVMALPGIRYAVTANGARVVDVQEDKVNIVRDGMQVMKHCFHMKKVRNCWKSLQNTIHTGKCIMRDSVMQLRIW